MYVLQLFAEGGFTLTATTRSSNTSLLSTALSRPDAPDEHGRADGLSFGRVGKYVLSSGRVIFLDSKRVLMLSLHLRQVTDIDQLRIIYAVRPFAKCFVVAGINVAARHFELTSNRTWSPS